MKKSILISLFSMAILYSSCSFISNTTNNTSATGSGASCGKILAKLYTQYKASGNIDITNTTTLTNVIELSKYYKALKSHQNDAAYKAAFAAGLVTGSNGIISPANSLTVVNKILSISGLDTISSSTASNTIETIGIVKELINLFNIL